MAGRSDFVRTHLKYLKENSAKSVISSTKQYCPSTYWWSNRPSADKNARTGFRKQMTREMSQSGFPASAIEHCVTNSGFVFKGLELQKHPKNGKYPRFVEAGIMVYRAKGSAQVSKAPVLIETSTHTDRRWRIYDSKFREICSMVEAGGRDVKTKCGSFGTLTGPYATNSGRAMITLKNARYDVLFLSRRTPTYAQQLFKKTFR